MTMSKADEDEGRDHYEPIRRLSMVQLQPPRNPGKPFTSFCIRDILGIASMESERNIQKCNNSISYIEHTEPRPLQQKQKTRGQADEPSEVSKAHTHPSRNDNSQKKSTIGKDTEAEILNTCRKDKHKLAMTTSMPLASLNRSTISNGRHRPSMSGLTSSFQYLAHGDLLHVAAHSSPVNLTTKIVRPWNNDLDIQSPSANSRASAPTPGTILTASEASSDEDEEISVDDDEPPIKTSASSVNKKMKAVSPLDALMAMTSKTFEGLEGGGQTDVRRRDQTTLFGKHQPPKKRRKSRTAFTNQQIYELEKRFLYQKYLTPADRDDIAASLGLTNAQVITWFQNRRAKLKRDLEELKNDVTAAKKLPVPKVLPPGSYGEMDLRRVQEKTLRDTFNSGGLHSPSSSLASLSDETRDTCSTPVHSPDEAGVDDDDEEDLASSRHHEEPMDTKCCDEDEADRDNESNINSEMRNLHPDEETRDREQCRHRDNYQSGLDFQSRGRIDGDIPEASFVQNIQSHCVSDVSV